MDELELDSLNDFKRSRNREAKKRSRCIMRSILITLFCIIILAVSLVVGLSFRRRPSQTVVVQPPRPPPEPEKPGKPEKPEEKRPNTFGLAFAGGAYPGGVVAAGLMRGFQRQKVMIDGEERPALDVFDYTAAVSGGTLATIPYAFAPNVTSDILLETSSNNDPSKLTNRQLESIRGSSIFARYQIPVANYMLMSILATRNSMESPSEASGRLHFWDNFMYEMFLRPFGVRDVTQPVGKTRAEVKTVPLVTTSVIGPSELYPDYISEQILNRRFAQVASRNSQKFGAINTGHLVGTRPMMTLPENNAETWEIATLSNFQIAYGAYILPDEFAIPILQHRAQFSSIGNKTATPLDFVSVSAHPDDVQPKGEGRFPLSKMLGVGTNLIAMQLSNLEQEIPPEMELLLSIPSDVEISTKNGEKRRVALTDAGYNSFNGVVALVKKKVRNIVCNLFSTDNTVQVYRSKGFNEPWVIGYMQLLKFFGIISQDPPPDFKEFNFAQYYTMHVFDVNSNGENQLNKYVEYAKSLYAAGEPMIFTLKDLDVVENRFWGIEGGGKVDLTIIVNAGIPKKFAEKVPLELVPPPRGTNGNVLDEYGFFANRKFNKVPNLVHRHQSQSELNIPELPDFANTTVPLPEMALSAEDIQMTKVLCTWMIERAWEGLVGDDGKVKFEGFKSILDGKK